MLILTRLEGGPKRVNHAAVAVDGIIYSFGGYMGFEDYSIERPIDVFTLNTVTLRWKELQYSDAGRSSNVPFKRYGHTAVAQDNIVYLWGGRREEEACNRVFLFDTFTRKWSAPPVSGSTPGSRDGHAACISQGYMYIFGGFEEEKQDFSDMVYALELKTLTWTCLWRLTSDILKRDFLTAITICDKIYLFGGRSYSSPFYDNNILELDLREMVCSLRVINGFKPHGRRSHSAVVVNNKMIIFGGYNDISNEHLNDFVMFDPITYKWTNLSVHGDSLPCPRRRHCCVAVNQFLYIFGGSCPLPQAANSEVHHLMELCDLFVIDTAMSLRSWALQAVIFHDLETKDLTAALEKEVESYKTGNDICKQFEKLDLDGDQYDWD